MYKVKSPAQETFLNWPVLGLVETPSEENGVERKQETRLPLQSSPCRSSEQSERPHDLQGCPFLLLLTYPLSLSFCQQQGVLR